MKGKKKVYYTGGLLLVLGIVAILIMNTASSAPSQQDQGAEAQEAQPDAQQIGTQQIPAILLPTTTYQYAVKYVCGNGASSSGAVATGRYMTAINVHNPQSVSLSLKKKVAQAVSEDLLPIAPSNFTSYTIKPDYAFEIDCRDIYTIGNIGTAVPFTKGFVVINSPRQLDVVAVYTSELISSTGAVIDTNLEVETVKPKQILPAFASVAADIPVG